MQRRIGEKMDTDLLTTPISMNSPAMNIRNLDELSSSFMTVASSPLIFAVHDVGLRHGRVPPLCTTAVRIDTCQRHRGPFELYLQLKFILSTDSLCSRLSMKPATRVKLQGALRPALRRAGLFHPRQGPPHEAEVDVPADAGAAPEGVSG
jgi:hypothetical protein